MDKRDLIIGALTIISVAIFLNMQIPFENRTVPLNYSPQTENWTAVFRGYEVSLDGAIGYYVVSGTSMAPAFSTDDIILWVEFPIENLRIGDIIVYKHPTMPDRQTIAHRVFNIAHPGKVQPKGDGLPTADKYYATSEHYEGLVIGVLFTSSRAWRR